MEKSKQTKPTPPKRPMNSYMIYRANVYDDFKKKNPDMKITEIAKAIGDQFKFDIKLKLDQKEKDKINNQVEKLKKQYEKDMTEYKKKYGEPPKKSKTKSPKHSPKEKKEKQQKNKNEANEKRGKSNQAKEGKDKKKK